MKTVSNYFLLFLSIVIITACEDNLDIDNTPAIQAALNGEFFSAAQFAASANDDGTVTVKGVRDNVTVSFDIESDAQGIYFMGPGSESRAIVSVGEETIGELRSFSTEFGSGRGEISVYNTDAPNTVSADFSFIAYKSNGQDSLYMRRGVIFKVPFGGDLDIGGGVGNNEFAATINGTPFDVVSIVVNESPNFITIAGGQGSTSTISLLVPSDIAPGDYPLDNSNSIVATYFNSPNTSQSETGTLTIISNDAASGTMSGTFEFTTGPPNMFEITNGSFSVSY
ncbi:MAG: DUF6252 family protein [Nonlabens sp.]